MNKKLSSTQSDETQYHNVLKADGNNSRSTRSEKSHQNRNANTQWMPGSCRSCVPENKHY